MRQKIIAVLLALLSHVAMAYDVWFYPSWVDGKPTEYGDKVYIEVECGNSGPDYHEFDSGSTLTFHAEVPLGHEVSYWSRASYTANNYWAALEEGHFSEIIKSTSDQLTWTMPSSSQYLAVHLDWIKYAIDLRGNGATEGANQTQTGLVYNQAATIAANPFKKTGYAFAGWKMRESPTKTFADCQSVTGASFGIDYKNKSVTLDAQWTPNKYTVTYNADGGTFPGGGTLQTTNIVYDTTYGTQPTGLTRGGYVFKNSWTNAAGRVIGPETKMETAENHTLYAVWESVGLLRVDVIKSADDVGAEGSVKGDGNYAWGSTAHLQATPNTGNDFVRWTKDRADGEEISRESVCDVVVTGPVTYYGHFALKEYTVEFHYKNAQGGDEIATQKVKYGRAATPPSTPDYLHNKFVKWDSTDYTTVPHDLIINAVYQSTVLTVHFEPNGGDTVVPGELQYDVGDHYEGLPEPTRMGYSWDHKWWTRQSGGDPVTAETEVTQTGAQTLYAHWTPNEYTVTLDSNGGVETVKVKFDGHYGSLPEPERTGYDFKGWWTGKTSGEQVTSSTTVLTDSDHKFYAHWQAQKFWVSLQANGGSVTPSSVQVVYDSAYAGLNDATRIGYRFLGWFTQRVGGDQVHNGERVEITANQDLYAHWEPKKFTITFDPKGGAVGETSREVMYDDAYGKEKPLPEAIRKGYTFMGWYTQNDIRVNDDTLYTRDGDQTLIAKWQEKTFELFYQSNGGAGWMNPQTFTWDKPQQLRDNAFSRTGYGFMGWAETADATEVAYENQAMASNLTEAATCQLYALWQPNTYTVTFAANGGAGEAMKDLALRYDESRQLPKCTWTNGGRDFTGWLGSDGKAWTDGAVVSNLTSVKDGVYTMTAQWGNTYRIAYDGNGATNTVMASQTVEASDPIEISSNLFARVGYTFAGWATNRTEAIAGKVFYADGALIPAKTYSSGTTVTLVAVWRNNKYKVKYYPNGGEGTSQEYEKTYDVNWELPTGKDGPEKVNFSRERYDLVGWLTDPTNETWFAVGQVVSNLTAEANGTVALFAKWLPEGGADFGALSLAADCASAAGARVAVRLETDAEKPADVTVVTNDVPINGGNNQYVRISPAEASTISVKAMGLSGAGTLSFYYKAKLDTSALSSKRGSYTFSPGSEIYNKQVSTDGWVRYECHLTQQDASDGLVWSLTIKRTNTAQEEFCIDNVAWIPDETKVSVTFRANDGTIPPADIAGNVSYTAGAEIGVLPNLEREGLVLLGWATNATATEPDVSETWTVPAVDTQLYAVWKSGSEDYPIPTEADRPVIGAGFSFMTDARFDYVIWTTESLESPIVWTPGEPIPGTGEAVKLPGWLGVAAGGDALRYGDAPQRFYKVEVRQRK